MKSNPTTSLYIAFVTYRSVCSSKEELNSRTTHRLSVDCIRKKSSRQHVACSTKQLTKEFYVFYHSIRC